MRLNNYFLIFSLALTLASCEKSDVDPALSAPFQAPIEEYFRNNSYGMAISRFKAVGIEGDQASITASLHAADAPQVHVTWKFEVEKRDGNWFVVRHQVLE